MEICISQLYQNLKVLGPLDLILLLVHGGCFAILPATFWCWAQSAFSRCCQCSKVQIFCLIVVSPHCLDYLDRLFWLSMSPKSSHYTERGSSKESSLEILPNHVRHASTISCLPPLVRVEICRDRHDRRSCKICTSCVTFFQKTMHFLA